MYERTYSTERGFFALPRLAASWIALAGFETPPPFLEDLYLEAAGNPLIITGSLVYFDLIYVMTGGGPGNASYTLALYIYQAAFQNQEVGYGSAIAVLLFAVILLVTAVQFFLSKRWVFYQ